MGKNDFSIKSISFIVPNLKTAENIFEKGLGLKCISHGEDKKFLAYEIDKETTLHVTVDSDIARYDWPWNSISLYTSSKNILKVFDRLKKVKEKVRFSTWETNDKKKKIHNLTITVGLNAQIHITDRLRSDTTKYYPTEVPKTERDEVFVPLPENLFKEYKKQAKVKSNELSLDEIRSIFLLCLRDFLNKKLEAESFAGICDELSRQFNSLENRREYMARSYFSDQEFKLSVALYQGVDQFLLQKQLEEAHTKKQYDDILTSLKKYLEEFNDR